MRINAGRHYERSEVSIMKNKKTKITIDAKRCKGCLLCVQVCPKKILEKGEKVNKRGIQCVIVKTPEDCIACGLCAVMCPDCAIEVNL